MNMNIVKAIEMLRSIVQGYFLLGEMPIQHASARAAIAVELIANALGMDADEKLVKMYENDPDCHLVLFPDNNSIENNINNLIELLDDISDKTSFRNQLMFIGNEHDNVISFPSCH
jgi:hypothetical protein